ncbi:MAG: hypothetical protein Q9222_004922 [Ikaeria aurantiellina]
MQLESALRNMDAERRERASRDMVVSMKNRWLEVEKEQDQKEIARLRQVEHWYLENHSKLWTQFEKLEQSNHELQARQDHDHEIYREAESDLREQRQEATELRAEIRWLQERKPSSSLSAYPFVPMTETTTNGHGHASEHMVQGDKTKQTVATQTEIREEQEQAHTTAKETGNSVRNIPEIPSEEADLLHGKIAKLEQDVAAKTILHDQTLSEKAQVERRKEELESNNRTIQEALNKARVDIEEESKSSSKKDERLEKARTEISQLEHDNERLQKANTALEGEKKTLGEKNEVLLKTEGDLADARLEIGQLQKEMKVLKDTNTALEKKDSDISANEEALQEIKEALRVEESNAAQLRRDAECAQKELTAAHTKAVEVEVSTKQHIEEVEKSAQDSYNNYLISQNSIQNLMNEVATLKHDLSGAQEQRDKHVKWGNELRSYLLTIWRTLKMQEELPATYADLINEVRNQSMICTSLQEKVAEITQQRDQLQQLKMGDSSTSELQSRLEDTTGKLEQALSNNRTLGKEYLESKNLVSKQRDRIAALQGELKRRELERDGSRATNDPLRKQLQTQSERVQELGRNIQSLEARKLASEHELQKLGEETKKLERGIKELKGHKNKLLATCNSLRSKGAAQEPAQGSEKRTHNPGEEEQRMDGEGRHSTKLQKVADLDVQG